MIIHKSDIEGAAKRFCELRQIPADEVHPQTGTLNWQVAADRIADHLCIEEALRLQLEAKSDELSDKLNAMASSSNN